MASSKKTKKRTSIRTVKYVISSFTVCITAVFLLFFSTYTIYLTKNITQKQCEQDCKTIAQAYSHVVNAFLEKIETSLYVFAFNDYVIEGSTSQIVKHIIAHNYMKPHYFSTLFFVDLNGKLTTSEGMVTDASDREYFKKLKDLKPYDFVVGDITSSKTKGIPSIQAIVPIYSSDMKLKGGIGASIDLIALQNSFDDSRINFQGRIFLLDKNGLFIAHPDKNFLMKKYTPSVEAYKEITSEVVSKQRQGTFDTISTTGEKVRIFFLPVDNTDWTVGVSVPYSYIFNLYNILRMLQIFSIVVIVVIIVIFVSIGYFSIFKINKSYDPITDLYTQEKFESKARKLLKKHKDSRFVLIDADLRGFKFINQNYGEVIANKILVKFGNILKEKTDSVKGICGKGYADHFYIFAKITSPGKTIEYFNNTIDNINNLLKQEDFPIHAKYGISFLYPEKVTLSSRKTIKNLIGEASFAKSLIKENLTKEFEIYSPKIEEKIRYEQKIEHNTEKAISNDEFFVMYQPKIDLETDKIVGAEALVRWKSSDKDLGLLNPGQFIPLFERNGFIEKLDFIVYEKVFKFLRNQIDIGNPVVPISVNMSRNHTKSDKINNFITNFISAVEKYKISPELIEVEILEQSVANDKILLQKIIEELHYKGFSIAMDDFGSGESSLNMLSSIPIDVVKYDQNFLRHNNLKDSYEFISSLVELGKKLNKKIVFEGVETKEQRDFLKSIKCDLAQGYFYSKPLIEEDFINFIKKYK